MCNIILQTNSDKRATTSMFTYVICKCKIRIVVYCIYKAISPDYVNVNVYIYISNFNHISI